MFHERIPECLMNFVGFRRALYHSIGTQTENNRPSYFDWLLGIFEFYKLQHAIRKKYRKGYQKIEPRERSLAMTWKEKMGVEKTMNKTR